MQGLKKKDCAAKATNWNIESKTFTVLESTAAAVARTLIWKMDYIIAQLTEKISIMNVLRSTPSSKLSQL